MLRHFVMLLTVTSILNQATTSFVYYSSCPMRWYRFLIGTLLQLLWNIYDHKMPFLSIYQAYIYEDYTRYLRATTFIGLNRYKLSFTASFILIVLTVASGKVVTGKMT